MQLRTYEMHPSARYTQGPLSTNAEEDVAEAAPRLCWLFNRGCKPLRPACTECPLFNAANLLNAMREGRIKIVMQAETEED